MSIVSKNKKNKTVNIITNNNLCISCGVCKVVCPTRAIQMVSSKGQYIPKINWDTCVFCPKCLDYCPSHEIDITKMDNYNAEDQILGKFTSIVTGHYNDEGVRYKSTSGGMVSGLIGSLIQDRLYDGAFILKDDVDIKQEIKVAIATTIDDINKSSKSKYCPVSVENVIETLSDRNNRKKKYIIVGTGCQLWAILEFIRRKPRKLDRNNYLILGLFCDATMNTKFINYLEDKYSRNSDEIQQIDFRSKENCGWPGDLKLDFKLNDSIHVNSQERAKVKYLFKLNRCNYCFDKSNIQADLSFADNYVYGSDNKLGSSNMIIRSKRGQEIIRYYADGFTLSPEFEENIIRSQGLSKSYHKMLLGMRYFNVYVDNVIIPKDRRKSRILDLWAIRYNKMFTNVGTKYNYLIVFYFKMKLATKFYGFINKLLKVITN